MGVVVEISVEDSHCDNEAEAEGQGNSGKTKIWRMAIAPKGIY